MTCLRPLYRRYSEGILPRCRLILLLFLMPIAADAQIAQEYSFETGSATYSAMTGGTEVLSGTTTSTSGTFDADRSVGNLPIGFDFVFDCVTYSEFNVATSGFLTLGPTAYGASENLLESAGRYPLIAAFWDFLHLYDGNCVGGVTPNDVGVFYRTTGTAPNRVLEIEWRVQFQSGTTTYWYGCTAGSLLNFKARLFETTNVIEFHYGPMYQFLELDASIGIAAATNDFLSITPGTPPKSSSTKADNDVDPVNTSIAAGTIYRFLPDRIVVDGRVGPGNEGVDPITDNDTIFEDVLVFFGTSTDYTPIDIGKACAAPDATLDMMITGPQGTDYSFDATGTQNYSTTLSGAGPATPIINFSPSGGGVREATLTVRDNLEKKTRIYKLLAEVEPRIEWRGFPVEGGTLLAESGDTLLDGFQVVFGNSASWRPIELENILKPGVGPPADITYEIIDPTGSYTIDRLTDAIDGGETSRPEITFDASNGVGYIEATLNVTVDGETRSYLLRAFSAAPGGVLSIDGEEIDSTDFLYVNRYACVGEEVISLPVVATNTGTGDFIVEGADVFLIDGEFGQGRPDYPLVRDKQGNVVPMQDYFLTLAPSASTRDAVIPFTQLVVPEGQERTFYLNFIPTREGRRTGRIYFRTNGFNLNGYNTEDVATQGMVSAQLRANGFAAFLSGEADADRPEPIIFDRIDVRESTTMIATVENDGECDLRIAVDDFRIVTGDVEEFSIVEAFAGVRQDRGDYVIGPGESGSITVRFSPQTYGTRVAQIQMKTNDSTIGDGLVSERGLFYWEIFGFGNIGVEALGVDFGPTVIDGNPSFGEIRIENTAPEPVEILGIEIDDPNGEIVADPAKPWPGFPTRIGPGAARSFGVLFAPTAAGGPGSRDVAARVILATGDTVVIRLRGFAGDRSLVAAPNAPFAGRTVQVGSVLRRYVGITNVGTLPVRLDGITVTGTDAALYSIVESGRRAIQPGTTEIVEVSFAPIAAGTTSATLEVASNATAGLVTVDLSAEGVSSGIESSDPVRTPNGTLTPIEGSGRTATGVGTMSLD